MEYLEILLAGAGVALASFVAGTWYGAHIYERGLKNKPVMSMPSRDRKVTLKPSIQMTKDEKTRASL